MSENSQRIKSVNGTKNSVIFLPWLSRALVAVVFASNLYAALTFISRPGLMLGSFQLSGIQGLAVVQGFGYLFLMWCVPFIPVIVKPQQNSRILKILICMQLIAWIGDSLVYNKIPASYEILRESILRFSLFDLGGAFCLIAALLVIRYINNSRSENVK